MTSINRTDDFRLAARIANILRQGEASASDIVTRLGCAKSACRRNLIALRGSRAIHIGHYRTGSNNCGEAVYRWGEGVDAVSPLAMPETPDMPTLDSLPRPTLGPWGCVW